MSDSLNDTEALLAQLRAAGQAQGCELRNILFREAGCGVQWRVSRLTVISVDVYNPAGPPLPGFMVKTAILPHPMLEARPTKEVAALVVYAFWPTLTEALRQELRRLQVGGLPAEHPISVDEVREVLHPPTQPAARA